MGRNVLDDDIPYRRTSFKEHILQVEMSYRNIYRSL